VGVGYDQLHAPKAPPCELAQELGPDRLGLGSAYVQTQNLAPPVGVHPDGDDDGDRDDPPAAPDLEVGGVDPQVGPIAFERAVQERLHLAVDLLAQAAHLALGDARHAHGLDEVIDRPRRDALNIGLLDHRRQRLLGHAPGFQKAREVAALPELRDAQFDRPGARLPVPVTISVALRPPRRVLLAIGRAGHSTDLQFHQPFGRKANHLAQKVRVRGLLDEVAQVRHVGGHRWSSRSRVGVSNQTLTEHRR
jgi:hypothetical protein